MKTKKILGFFLVAMIGGFVALFAYTQLFERPKVVISADQPDAVRLTNYTQRNDSNPVDFTYAAERTVHAVVHVKTVSMQSSYSGNPFYEFFFGYRGDRQEPVAGFGSGVIISADGYIVTNNHVIDDADQIEVTLNDKRTFPATVVGRDPDTDLAVLKINADNLPFIVYGNSDELKVGQWVLAIGNPYNLTSTVTAGIVSAKARNLNMFSAGGNGRINNPSAIESFIQTDAAVNPGNSGGALVNTNGELVGINTAIASPTGSYIGNSFAIPVTIVKKVVSDLIEFGKVQRALLGVTITDVNSDLAKDKGLDKIEGVYVEGVMKDGAAEAAGIKEGDVILGINGAEINSSSELQEQVSKYRPNDKVEVVINRDNKKKQILVTLRNMEGTTKIVTKDEVISVLGAQLADVPSSEKSKLGINNGVKVVDIKEGKLRSEGVQKGFIITRINNQSVSSVEDVKNILSGIKEGVYIEGVYPNGVTAYYAFGM